VQCQRDHLGRLREAGGGDDVDCLGIVPDFLLVQVDHEECGVLGDLRMRVLG